MPTTTSEADRAARARAVLPMRADHLAAQLRELGAEHAESTVLALTAEVQRLTAVIAAEDGVRAAAIEEACVWLETYHHTYEAAAVRRHFLGGA